MVAVLVWLQILVASGGKCIRMYDEADKFEIDGGEIDKGAAVHAAEAPVADSALVQCIKDD